MPMMPSKTAEHIRQQHQRILELRDENFKLRIQMDKLQKEKSESETLKLAIKVSRLELKYLSARVEEKRKELREMDALEIS